MAQGNGDARPFIVAGGGIGGLVTALTLHQIGLPCVVFEAVREMRPLGVGINLQPNAVRELYDLGITANDSYFTAMTFPQGMPTVMQPANLHDATWGAMSAVYGGAIHPTAEGHAAMADAALPAVRQVLGLQHPAEVTSEPLPPLIPTAR